jgi:hypothetical protein
MIVAACETEIHLTVTNFTGAPNGVHGTINYPVCVSPTEPQITHATVVVSGSATGTPYNITISEHDHVTWLDKHNKTVATSIAPLTRKMIGLPVVPAMVEVAVGVVVGGLFVHQKISVVAGLAMRSQSGKAVWVYTNESENDVDYG